MKSRSLPFENRWTSGNLGRQWYCELERLRANGRFWRTIKTLACELAAVHMMPNLFGSASGRL
jgi:hypothetical protein